MLIREGHRVDIVPSADVARRLVCKTGPDIVVTTLTLPDGSGLDLLDDLEHGGIKAVAIVPQSGSGVAGSQEREARAERLLVEPRDGAYFCQPFSRELLLQLIDARARRERHGHKAPPGPIAARLWPFPSNARGKIRV